MSESGITFLDTIVYKVDTDFKLTLSWVRTSRPTTSRQQHDGHVFHLMLTSGVQRGLSKAKQQDPLEQTLTKRHLKSASQTLNCASKPVDNS